MANHKLYARQDGTNYSLVLSAPSGAIAGTYSLRIFTNGTTDLTVTETATTVLAEPFTITNASFTLVATDPYLQDGSVLTTTITEAQFNSITALSDFTFTNNSISYSFIRSEQITLYNSTSVPRNAVFSGDTYKARLTATGLEISLPDSHGFSNDDSISIIVDDVQIINKTISVTSNATFDAANTPGNDLYGGEIGTITLTSAELTSISSSFTTVDGGNYHLADGISIFANVEIPLEHTFSGPMYKAFVVDNGSNDYQLVVSLPDGATIQAGDVTTDRTTDPANPTVATVTFNSVVLETTSVILASPENIEIANVPGTSFIRLEGINILRTIDAASNEFVSSNNIQRNLPSGNIVFLDITQSQFTAISNLGTSFTNPSDNRERFYLESDNLLVFLSNFIPTNERYEFTGDLPTQLSVGDFIWVSEEANGVYTTPSIAGQISTIGSNFISIRRNIPGVATYQTPVVGDMILWSKNNQVEKSGIIGFFAKVTMTNGSSGEIELFSADSETTIIDR